MAQVSREKVRIYALVPDTQAEGGAKKYYIVGRGTASGSIAFGYALEEQKDITQQQSSQSINKGAWSIQITGKAETSDNVHNYITMNSIRGNTENLLLDVLIIFEYIHKRGTPATAFALSGKAVLPLTSIGGDGQAKIQVDGTLSTSGDLTIGSIELNECGLSGVYKPETDTYETTSFKAGDIETNLDPHTVEKAESQPTTDENNKGGETLTPTEPETEKPKNPQTEDEPVKENPEEQPQVKNSVFAEDDWASRDCEFKAYKDETNFIQFKVSSKQITPTGYFYGETPTALNEVPAGKKYNFKIVDGELKFVSDNVVNNIYEDEAKDKPVKCVKIELVNDAGQVENNEEV